MGRVLANSETPEFECWLHYLLAVWPWANLSASPGLPFLDVKCTDNAWIRTSRWQSTEWQLPCPSLFFISDIQEAGWERWTSQCREPALLTSHFFPSLVFWLFLKELSLTMNWSTYHRKGNFCSKQGKGKTWEGHWSDPLASQALERVEGCEKGKVCGWWKRKHGGTYTHKDELGSGGVGPGMLC